ncbi:MAG: hypothetical protein ACYC9U_09125 [Nitrososphaerales archaeon]
MPRFLTLSSGFLKRSAPALVFFISLLGLLILILTGSFNEGLLVISFGFLILPHWFYALSGLFPANTRQSRRRWALPFVILADCAFASELVFVILGYYSAVLPSAMSIIFFFLPLMLYNFRLAFKSWKVRLSPNSTQ